MKFTLTFMDGYKVEAQTPLGLLRQLKGKSMFTERETLREYCHRASKRYQMLGWRVSSQPIQHLIDLHLQGLAKVSIEFNRNLK